MTATLFPSPAPLSDSTAAFRRPAREAVGVVVRRCPTTPDVLRHAVVVVNALYGDGEFPERVNGRRGEFSVLVDGVEVIDWGYDPLPPVDAVLAAVRAARVTAAAF